MCNQPRPNNPDEAQRGYLVFDVRAVLNQQLNDFDVSMISRDRQCSVIGFLQERNIALKFSLLVQLNRQYPKYLQRELSIDLSSG